MNGATPLPRLLVLEDSLEDFETLLEALAADGYAVEVQHTERGEDCLALLAGCEPAQLPALVLLDLNVPGTDGREMLARIRAVPGWQGLAVVVLTTSTNARDADYCGGLGVREYHSKPLEYPAHLDLLRGILARTLTPASAGPA